MLLPESALLKGPIEESELLLLRGPEPMYGNEALFPPVFATPGVAVVPGTEAGSNVGESTGGVP